MDNQWSLSNQLETISKYLFYGALIFFAIFIASSAFSESGFFPSEEECRDMPAGFHVEEYYPPVPCPKCLGFGTVSTIIVTDKTCPLCNGKGYKEAGWKWRELNAKNRR